ncbi:hypothetical protein BU17DRAFT_77705 [Hysterangium stoloniferum]|nr:hypothetical protein BU17DRAFT_77705 [Hysterangium stoloniferum]
MARKPATWLAFSILLYVFLLHTSTLYLFMRGFLLTRLSLPNISTCDTCTLPRTHSRLVLLVIDALRFDFISPQPAITPSPHYHNVLTLPAQLTEKYPEHSFIFNTFSDPPTATLQRIKGITTGSLPTFVDMGSNFAASQIAEDSLLLQMQRAGKKMAFMGDDTWTTVYPTAFSHNMSFPYDSFNVEDLHSVDEGVIRHLFPLLHEEWDLLIGHFLGVDHVGHRLGPAHPTMAQKLKQMDQVLARVVNAIDNDTLLVVMGDHGMDRKGDHGGDGLHETSAATWIYSKAIPLSEERGFVPTTLVPTTTFPDAPVAHRSIQQIDLVPTLSLLLGLPIPFNNLGTVIPELFGKSDTLERALRLNADQIKAFFDAYRDSPSGGELNAVWRDIERSWQSIHDGDNAQSVLAMHDFTRLALSSCRSLWAKFNIVLMYVGLVSLLLGSATTWSLYVSAGRGVKYWEANGWPIITRAALASFTGGGLGFVLWLFLPFVKRCFDFVEATLAGASLASTITVLTTTVFKRRLITSLSRPSVFLSIHSLAFLSNSFTFWEDRMLTFLLVASLVPIVLSAVTRPQIERRLRNRILGYSAVFALCIRLASISTVCREEQHPYCHVTFYGSSTQSAPPMLACLLCIPVSYTLSKVIRRFLAISASDKGPAPVFLTWGFTTVLIAGNAYWLMEALDSDTTNFRDFRTYTSMFGLGLPLMMGYLIWWYLPLCLELRATQERDGRRHELIGFANSYGSSFLLFTLISFSVIFYVSQLVGQIALALSLVALLALLEVIDSVRDVQSVVTHWNDKSEYMVPKITFSEIVPISLLALQAFYSTGHQSTMPSIQWKSAFLLTSTVTYPISPILVFMNFFGPLLFFAIAAPLLAVWKVDPLSETRVPSPDKMTAHVANEAETGNVSHSPRVVLSALRAALGMSLYFSVLLLSSAASSAWLRRHLMVWKVFAPRFMMAGVAALVVDLGALIGVSFAVGRVVTKVDVYFKPLLREALQ